jgi:DNA-directed RNA polymerase subunit RPC12/RpoP
VRFKCERCGSDNEVPVPTFLIRRVRYTCTKCGALFELRPRLAASLFYGLGVGALLALVATAIINVDDWRVPPYLALIVAGAVVLPLVFVFRSRIVSFCTRWEAVSEK